MSREINVINNEIVKDIISGSDYTALLLSSNRAEVLSENESLVNSEIVSQLRNVKWISTGQNHTLALLENGTVVTWGKNDEGQLGLDNYGQRSEPQVINALTNGKSISVGSYHTLALMNDRTVKAWGRNNRG